MHTNCNWINPDEKIELVIYYNSFTTSKTPGPETLWLRVLMAPGPDVSACSPLDAPKLSLWRTRRLRSATTHRELRRCRGLSRLGSRIKRSQQTQTSHVQLPFFRPNPLLLPFFLWWDLLLTGLHHSPSVSTIPLWSGISVTYLARFQHVGWTKRWLSSHLMMALCGSCCHRLIVCNYLSLIELSFLCVVTTKNIKK